MVLEAVTLETVLLSLAYNFCRNKKQIKQTTNNYKSNMKKRTYIVAAMAFAALVGCQRDLLTETVIDKIDGQDLSQRPVVGNSILSFGSAETRVVLANDTNADWKFKEGDQVGAMLSDELKSGINSNNSPAKGYVKVGDEVLCQTWWYADYVNGTTKTYGDEEYAYVDTYKDETCTVKNNGEEFYKITSNVWTNYPYNQVAGSTSSFQTEARLVEGHYVYYTPYNVEHTTRNPLIVTLPVNQDVSTEFKAVADFYAGNDPVLLTMTYLSAKATDTKVKAEMQPIFAYPKFTIINDFNGYLFNGKTTSTDKKNTYMMKIKQVELYLGKAAEDENPYASATKNLLAYQRTLYPNSPLDNDGSKAEGLKKALDNNGTVEGWDKAANLYETAKTHSVLNEMTSYGKLNYPFAEEDNVVAFEGDIAPEVTKKAQRIVLDFKGKELAPGADYSFHVVMPAEDYTERGLFATILVEIEGTEYYIQTNQVTGDYNTGYSFKKDAKISGMTVNAQEYATFSNNKITGTTDYQFVDRFNHASDNIVLVRGERFPVAEVNADRTAKNFVGDLLKIVLVGGDSQIAVAKKKVVTPEPEEPEVPKGILTTDDLLNYLNDVHRDAHVREVDEYDDDNATFNFLKDEEGFDVVINADVIAALENRLPDGSITLTTNLPIAAGVSVELVEDKTYEFSANGHKYQITYTEEFPNEPTVVNGINVDVTGKIEAKDETVTGAVVFTKGDTSLENPAGIVTINVADGTTLTVNATADVTATILAENAIVAIENGSKNLTNPNNKFDKVINSALVAFEGSAETVEYSCFGWDIAPIAANTKVNFLKINPTTASGINSFEIDNAAVALVANLKDVTIELGSNITGLTSKSNVELTNINTLTAVNSLVWNISGSNPVVVSNAEGIDTEKITAGEGVTFKK